MNMRKKNIMGILLLMLATFPTFVFAKGEVEAFFALIFVEAFVTIHMTFFVLLPLSKLLCKDGDSKSLFKKLFIGRIIILLIGDLIIGGVMAGIDFIMVFIGAFLIVPILSLCNRKNVDIVGSTPTNTTTNFDDSLYTCKGCGAQFKLSEKLCPYCKSAPSFNTIKSDLPQNYVNRSNYHLIYSLPEEKMLDIFVEKAIQRSDIDLNSDLIPRDLLKRRNILSFIFSFLVFIFITLIFFHFPIYTYIIGIIILVCYCVLLNKYSLISYIKKEVKARPSEKISNILASIKSNMVSDNLKIARKVVLVICVLVPLFIFYNPRIMYEKNEKGYSVRFYIFGLSNFTSATIPNEYNGLPVTGLRGNTFSNMPFLKKVTLPDTITEIRGQAFYNDRSLVEVNIPSKLEYLGGGAFYNCTSIENIELPDTLTYMGGETFYNAKKLKSVKLSKNLSEIRGNSFEECRSLQSIDIPDAVRRIGGHAFYGARSLSQVNIGENSQLEEIGSSAFRICTSLQSITIPVDTYVNERAFKESPTVIHRMGEQNTSNYNYYDNIDNLKYSSLMKFSHSKNTLIFNGSYADSVTYRKSLKYIGSFRVNGNYRYTFEYGDGYTKRQFSLSSSEPSFRFNNDLVFTIIDSNYFSYNYGYVEVYAYYN